MRRVDLALLLAGAAAVLAAAPGMTEDAAGQVEVRPTPLGAYTPADPNMIAVADHGNDRIQVFWPNGTFAFKFGFEFNDHHRRAADLAVGPDGRIFVANYAGSGVTAFHPNGSYAFLLGYRGGALGQFAGPYAVAVGPDGRIVVSDSDDSGGRVQVFRPDGEFALAFNYDSHIYRHAHDVAVGPDGRIFVGGGGSDGVFRVFHPNGSLAADFDPPGRNYGNLIDVGPDGRVVVIARLDGDDGVYVLHPNGSHVMTGQALHPNGSLAADGRPVRLDNLLPPGPIDFAIGSDGQIVVSSRYNHSVRVFHPNGSLALAFGSYGALRDGFDSPTDVAVGPDGQIVVAEPGTRSIQVFRPNGSLAAEFGSRGAADGKFYTPSIVDVGPDGQIVVGDTAKRRVQVFRPAPNGSSYAFDGVAFGSHGLGERQFSSLADVAVGPDGMIVTADSDSGSVRAFHPNGSLALRLDHGADFPTSVAVGPDGQIVVGGIVWDEYHEYRSNVVSVLHPYTGSNGSLVFRPSLPNGSLTIGSPTHLDSAASMSVAVAPNGRIIVGTGGVVHVLNPDGTLAFERRVDITIARIAVGSDGRLVAVDTSRKLVHAFNPDGSFAFSLLPSLRDGQFNGPVAVAVGPLSIPAPVGPPAPLVAVIGQPLLTGGAGGVPHNFTDVGDSANVTIDVRGLANPGAPPFNGSESSTVTFPPVETVVAASFATVSFPPNATAAHVPAGGLLALHVSADVPAEGLVLEALAPNGSGSVVLRRIVEVGGHNASVVFDRPIRILLEGQAGGRAFYIAGASGTITPIDGACAADDAAEVHAQLGGSGECQMDSAAGGKIIYTYHLTRFGTAELKPAAPAPDAADSMPYEPHRGSIVVADSHNNRIKVFHSNGTFAFAFGSMGSIPGKFYKPVDVAVGPDGRIAVADNGNDRVQVFHSNGTFAFAIGSPYIRGLGSADEPLAVAFGPDGRIGVIGGAGFLEIFHPNGTFAFRLQKDTGGSFFGGLDIAIGFDRRIVVLNGTSISVFYPNGTLNSTFGSGTHIDRNYHHYDPVGIAIGPDGRIAISAPADNHIRAFHPNGTLAFTFGSNGTDEGQFQFRQVSISNFYGGDLAIGPDGHIVVADRDNDRVQIFHHNGTFMLAFGMPGDSVVPNDVTVGPDGRIAVLSYNSVRIFHPNGTLDFEFGPGEGDKLGFFSARSIAYSPSGDRIAVDVSNGIMVFHPNGTLAFEITSSGSGDTRFSGGYGIAIGPDGRIAVAHHSGNRVQIFHPNGTHALKIDSLREGGGRLYSASGIAIGPDGRIAVGNSDNGLVRVFHPNGTLNFTFNSGRTYTGFHNHPDIAIGPDGRIVVSNNDDHRVRVFSSDGTYVSGFGSRGTDDGQFIMPSGIAIGPDGRIVVADGGHHGIQAFHPNGTLDIAFGSRVTDAQFYSPSAVDVGPLPPPAVVELPIAAPPSLLPPVVVDPTSVPVTVVVENEGGQYNFTSVGDAANLTINVVGLAGGGIGGAGGAPPLDGSASSMVTFPTSETTDVSTSFATVSFPPGVTAAHVPAGGRLALHISVDVPDDAAVQGALAYDGSGRVVLQRVIEIGGGGGQARVTFDMPVRILLDGQAGGRAFYIEGAAGAITPIDAACAADDTGRVHVQLGGAGECQIDSADGSDKIIYTYHLTRFGTATSERATPPPLLHTCSAGLESPSLDVRVAPGERSPAVQQTLINSGSLPFEHVGLVALPWYAAGPDDDPRPGAALLPSSATVLSVDGQGGRYAPLANETAVAHGLGGGLVEDDLWFRLNLSAYGDLQGGTLVQSITYQAQCAPP